MTASSCVVKMTKLRGGRLSPCLFLPQAADGRVLPDMLENRLISYAITLSRKELPSIQKKDSECKQIIGLAAQHKDCRDLHRRNAALEVTPTLESGQC